MPATKVQTNWCPVSFAGTPLKKITAVNINQGGTLLEHSADCDCEDCKAKRVHLVLPSEAVEDKVA